MCVYLPIFLFCFSVSQLLDRAMYIDHNPAYIERPQGVSGSSSNGYSSREPSYAVVSDSATRGPSHVRAPRSHMTSAAPVSQHYEVQQPASRDLISQHYEVQEQLPPVSAQDYEIPANVDAPAVQRDDYSRLQYN